MTLHDFLKQILRTTSLEKASVKILTATIYQNHFTQSGRKTRRALKVSKQKQNTFVKSLQKANVVSYCWTSLDMKRTKTGEEIFLLNGLNIAAFGREWRKKARQYEVKLPNYSIEPDAWFRFFAGDFQKNSPGPLARIYFNCTPKGAVKLLEVCSKLAAKSEISFSLKLAIDLKTYDLRNDCCILYYRRADEKNLKKHIAKIMGNLVKKRGLLRPQILPLTRHLAPGICYAEDPIDKKDSFGWHRCSLIAKGLVGKSKDLKFNEYYKSVTRVWVEEGFLPEKPWYTPIGKDPKMLQNMVKQLEVVSGKKLQDLSTFYKIS